MELRLLIIFLLMKIFKMRRYLCFIMLESVRNYYKVLQNMYWDLIQNFNPQVDIRIVEWYWIV